MASPSTSLHVVSAGLTLATALGGGCLFVSTGLGEGGGAGSSSVGTGGGGGGEPTLCGEAGKLVACYSFENGFIDESPNGNDPMLSSPPAFVPGKVSQGVNVAGVVASMTDMTTWKPAEITVEAWIHPVHPPAGTGRAGILDAQGGFSVFLYAQSEDDASNLQVIRCSFSGTVWGTRSIPANAWTHVACVDQSLGGASTRVSLYVNGQLDASMDFQTAFTPDPSDVFIGSNVGGAFDEDPFDGILDNFRVFNVARTAQEICLAAGGDGC
jgi:hypothetical protein